MARHRSRYGAPKLSQAASARPATARCVEVAGPARSSQPRCSTTWAKISRVASRSPTNVYKGGEAWPTWANVLPISCCLRISRVLAARWSPRVQLTVLKIEGTTQDEPSRRGAFERSATGGPAPPDLRVRDSQTAGPFGVRDQSRPAVLGVRFRAEGRCCAAAITASAPSTCTPTSTSSRSASIGGSTRSRPAGHRWRRIRPDLCRALRMRVGASHG